MAELPTIRFRPKSPLFSEPAFREQKKSLFYVEKALKSIEKSLNLQQGVKTRNR